MERSVKSVAAEVCAEYEGLGALTFVTARHPDGAVALTFSNTQRDFPFLDTISRRLIERGPCTSVSVGSPVQQTGRRRGITTVCVTCADESAVRRAAPKRKTRAVFDIGFVLTVLGILFALGIELYRRLV